MHKTKITEENVEQVAAEMAALDQADELVVGCETWGITLAGGQGGQMTVWPSGRGAIARGAYSDWGYWDEGVLVLDDGGAVDEWGEEVVLDEDDSMSRTREDVIEEVSDYISDFLDEPQYAEAIAADLVRRADAPVDGEYRLELPGRDTRDGNPVPFTVPAEASAV